MADWANPLIDTLYSDWPDMLTQRATALATMFNDGVTWTGLPNNTLRWNSGSDRFEKWNGSVWSNLSSSLTDTLKASSNLSDLASVSTARTNLGLGDIALENSPLALNKGGTGATTQSAARTALGLGSIATQAASSVAITGGTLSGITALTMTSSSTFSMTSSGIIQGVTLIRNAGIIQIYSTGGTSPVYLGVNSTYICNAHAAGFSPETQETLNLGDTAHRWAIGYISTLNSGNIDWASDISVKFSGTTKYVFSSSDGAFRPNSDGSQNLGSASFDWADVFCRRVYTDVLSQNTDSGTANIYLGPSGAANNVRIEAGTAGSVEIYVAGALRWYFGADGKLNPFNTAPDYTTSGTSDTRSINGSSSTTDVRNILATVIKDLQNLGLFA